MMPYIQQAGLHFTSLDMDWAVGPIERVELSAQKGQHEYVTYHLLSDKH